MNLVTLGNTKENDKEAWVLMGRQALTSKESELAWSPSRSVKAPSPQGIPREPPVFPGIAPVVCWDLGPDSLERLPLKPIPNLSKMNQNNIELCKTTGF